jgi:hypothetical protein
MRLCAVEMSTAPGSVRYLVAVVIAQPAKPLCTYNAESHPARRVTACEEEAGQRGWDLYLKVFCDAGHGICSAFSLHLIGDRAQGTKCAGRGCGVPGAVAEYAKAPAGCLRAYVLEILFSAALPRNARIS